MQAESNNEKLIAPKKQYLKELYEKYNSAYAQLGQTLNYTDKVSLNKTIESLENEIQQVQDKIKKLQSCLFQADNREFYKSCSKNWEDKFPKIDFHQTNRIFKATLGKFKNKEGAALFLLQNSRSMGGDWCIKNIKYQLQDMGNWYSPCEFEFLPCQKADPIDFLNYLAEKFSAQSCDEITTYTNKIINKICDSLRSGNILFIQIDICDFTSQDTFLDWFVQQFWCKLLEKLPEITQKYPLIRFVAVLSVCGSMPQDFLLSDLCCKSNKFDSKKILDLPLKRWTEEEINNWLFNFSGLTATNIGVTTEEIKRMAYNIHQATKGTPDAVYNQLMKAMSDRVKYSRK